MEPIENYSSDLNIAIDSLYKQSNSLNIEEKDIRKLSYIALVSVAKEENKILFDQLKPHLEQKIQRLVVSENGFEKALLTGLIELHKEHKLSKRLSNAEDIVGSDVSKCIASLVTQSIEEALLAKKIEVKKRKAVALEKENELQMSIRKTKIAAYSNILTAFIAAGTTALTIYFSQKC